MYGGIEAGGTKFVCAIGSAPHEILEEVRIPTTTPEETIGQAVEFFKRAAKTIELSAIGIASFGPIDLCQDSPTFGYITSTPKPGWANTNFLGSIREALKIPCVFDLDVNASAFGEYYWNPENNRMDPLLYITIGTGIGLGGIINGNLIHGLIHSEAGHIRIPHDWIADPFSGNCPFHGDCFEGLASGPALNKRWGQPAETLPADHPAWEMEANYIALALNNIICTVSPRRIVLGGGVMQHPGLLDMIHEKVLKILNQYLRSSSILTNIEKYIVLPSLGHRSGVLGAIALARNFNSVGQREAS